VKRPAGGVQIGDMRNDQLAGEHRLDRSLGRLGRQRNIGIPS
jgi:hypothetical protein